MSVVAILKNHLTKQQGDRNALGSAYDDHDLVFCWEDGRPRDPSNVTKAFRKALRNKLDCAHGSLRKGGDAC